jgi:transposase
VLHLRPAGQRLRRERIGRHTERLDTRQIALLFDTLLAQGVTTDAIDPETEAREDAALDRNIADAEQGRRGARRRKRRKIAPGWRTTGVEHQVQIIDVPADDQTCPTCQTIMDDIGVDVTRRLKYVPGHFVEEESHRQKRACRRCKEGVITAPAPPQVLPRCAADASLLAHVVVSKFADHTPLHRLHRIYARSGADIPVSILADWVAGVGTLVEPLVERLAARVRAASIVRTDATGLKWIRGAPITSHSDRSGRMSVTIATSSSAIRQRPKARRDRGRFSRGAPATSKPMRRPSSIGSSPDRRRGPSRSGAWRTLAES